MDHDRTATGHHTLEKRQRKSEDRQAEVGKLRKYSSPHFRSLISTAPSDRVQTRGQAGCYRGGVVSKRKVGDRTNLETGFSQQERHRRGSKVYQVPWNVQAMPPDPKNPGLERVNVRNLNDQATPGFKQAFCIFQRSPGIGQMFEDMEHGDNIKLASLPCFASNFTFADVEIILFPRNRNRVGGNVLSMSDESSPARKV